MILVADICGVTNGDRGSYRSAAGYRGRSALDGSTYLHIVFRTGRQIRSVRQAGGCSIISCRNTATGESREKGRQKQHSCYCNRPYSDPKSNGNSRLCSEYFLFVAAFA